MQSKEAGPGLALLPSTSVKESAAVISGGQDVKQMQCRSGSDNIMEEMVIIEALPPLQVWLPQLGPAHKYALVVRGTVVLFMSGV